jgi:hypothetical protein
MLDALEIRKEIARLEYEPSSYPNYAKLADLYTIRAEMDKDKEPQSVSMQSAPGTVVQSIPAYSGAAYGNSDFLRTVSDKEPRDAWRVMDELMESLSVMQPRTYAAVMNKLNNL